MTTQREAILDYITTLIGTIEDATAYRSREAAFDRSEGVGILVKPEDEQTELRSMFGGSTVLRSLTVVVTILARGAIPDQIADPIIAGVHAAITADRTLGGRCALVIEHSTKWDFEVADQTAVAAELRFIVRYQTSASDLTAQI